MLYHRRNVRRDNDKELVRTLLRWFRANARDLPWRDRPLAARRDPYRVLVSEVMLQQTQASRVTERFDRFIDRFPTVGALAEAEEPAVLALWSGLGYYRRARSLHAAARVVTAEHGGRFPDRATDLVRLPGIGRYTAGAVASLAFGERTAAVDANVTRVVLRLEGQRLATSDAAGASLAWGRAESLHLAAPRTAGAAGLLNEALIELGALVCTPRSPRCAACPISGHCLARARGIEREIPVPKNAPERKPLYLASVLIADAAGRLAVTRRAADDTGGGLWVGLHQAPTIERADRRPTTAEVRGQLGLPPGRRPLRRVASFPFQTTHRACTFDVYEAKPPGRTPAGWTYLGREAIADLGLSSPQRRILLELGGPDCPRPGG